MLELAADEQEYFIEKMKEKKFLKAKRLHPIRQLPC